MMSSFLLPVQVSGELKVPNNHPVVQQPIFRYMPHALVIAIAMIMAGCSSSAIKTNPKTSKQINYQTSKQSKTQTNKKTKVQGSNQNSTQSSNQSSNQINHQSETETTSNTKPVVTPKVSPVALDLESADAMEELLQATDMDAVEGDRLSILRYGNIWKRIPLGFRMDLDVDNPRINGQRNWFVSRQTYMERLSARASRYLYYTVTEAERRGIPTELALLPVIESSYDPFATSNAAAAGMWQFIPSTGRIYGLRQDQFYDGRRDVVESTRAAYDFLTALYQKFGSWELALASYNAGGGRVQQAINRNIAQGLPTDYWSLKLPQETMNYVPRFIAVAQIIKNPELFGVQLPKIANRSHFRTVTMSGPVDLTEVALATGLSNKEVLELNPGFLKGVTAPLPPFRLLIPNSLAMSVDNSLKALPIIEPSRFGSTPMSAPITQTITQTINRTIKRSDEAPNLPAATVRNRENIPADANALAAMANQAVVPSQARISKALANIDSDTIGATNPKSASVNSSLPPSITMEIMTRPATNMATSSVRADGLKTESVDSSPIVVAAAQSNNTSILALPIDQKDGNDTAGMQALSVAEKNAVVSEIRSIAPDNTIVVDPLDGKISLTVIQTQQTVLDKQGQTKELTFEQPYLKSNKPSVASGRQSAPVDTKVVNDQKEPTKPKGIRTIYVVKAGDTLNSVGNKSGLNWRDIAKWNQMDANAVLITGVPLYLYDAKKTAVDAAPTRYVVQAGDTLTDVADRFNLTTRQLADRNDLKVTSNLMTGQRLNLVDRDEKGSNKDQSSKDFEYDTSTIQSKLPTEDYKIKRGDTLAKIALRYEMSVADLAKLNGVPWNLQLQAGDTLTVPVLEKPTKRSKSKITDQPIDEEDNKVATTDYQVKPGETLSRIASRHKLTVAALAELNGIPADIRIQAGDTISVPSPEKAVQKKRDRES